MGIKSPTKNHPQVPNAEKYPASSKKTCNRNITSYPLSPDNTLERGPLLGIMRPIWIKTTESEERLRWLRQMISRNLMVRDLEAFLRATSDKLRSDISKIREEEREVLMRLMVIKRNDERRNLRERKKEKENLRRHIKAEYGRKRYYDITVKKLRKEVKIKRTELREKYDNKIKHLTEIRNREKEEKKTEKIPKI